MMEACDKNQEIEKLRDKCAILSRLPDGWDGGSAKSPRPLLLYHAGIIAEAIIAMTNHRPQVIPRNNGSVMLEWSQFGLDMTLYVTSDEDESEDEP